MADGQQGSRGGEKVEDGVGPECAGACEGDAGAGDEGEDEVDDCEDGKGEGC